MIAGGQAFGTEALAEAISAHGVDGVLDGRNDSAKTVAGGVAIYAAQGHDGPATAPSKATWSATRRPTFATVLVGRKRGRATRVAAPARPSIDVHRPTIFAI